MIEWLWGLKTVAIFDVWSYEHLLSGLSIGHIVKKKNRKHIKKHYPNQKIKAVTKYRLDYLFIFSLAFLWETVEHYLEQGLAGQRVEYWFQGVEFWPNRLIADPLMLVIGYAFIKRYPKLVWPARVLSISWLVVHIFIFPHSMYLHTLLS